ncbi:MAG: heat-shock protein [Gammaproteobacteria bacterium]|jgi:HSP20 family protein|nr:heat-shock protein [Gammaproteobacteria bacterium]
MAHLINWKKSMPVTSHRSRENPFLSLQTELDKAMQDFYNMFDFSSLSSRNFKDIVISPLVDMIEDGNCFKLEVEMPGLSEDNIKIDITNGRLIIKGEKTTSKEEDKNYISREIHYGSYERVIALPDTVDIDQVSASFEKGILYITMPKKEGSAQQSRAVKIEKANK